MADFCQQCSIEMFGKDFGELAHLLPEEDYSEDIGAVALCETCGPTVVDYEGKCIAKFCQEHDNVKPINGNI